MTSMRIPKRKPGKFSQLKPDPLITKEKFNELKRKLEKLKDISQPLTAKPKQQNESSVFTIIQ